MCGKIYIKIFAAMCAVWLSGCVRFSITADFHPDEMGSFTQENVIYQKGIQILRSRLESSIVQVELAQKDTAHNVIVLHISAQLAQSVKSQYPTQALLFSPANIRAYVGDRVLDVLNYEKLQKSGYDFIEILQDFNIPTPTPTINPQLMYYNISPFYYVANPGFLYYPLAASPFMIESPSSIAYAQEKRGALKVLLMNTLRESTLSSDKAQGGFVVVKDAGIKNGDTMVVEVRILDEVHRFAFKIEHIK